MCATLKRPHIRSFLIPFSYHAQFTVGIGWVAIIVFQVVLDVIRVRTLNNELSVNRNKMCHLSVGYFYFSLSFLLHSGEEGYCCLALCDSLLCYMDIIIILNLTLQLTGLEVESICQYCNYSMYTSLHLMSYIDLPLVIRCSHGYAAKL